MAITRSMQRKRLAAVLFTLCSVVLATVLLHVHMTGFHSRFHLYHPPPNGPSLSGCLNPQTHLWEMDVPYGMPIVLINPSRQSRVAGKSAVYDVMCQGPQTAPAAKQDFSDVLLIVGLSHSDLHQAVAFVELLYRRHFPHILYCSPESENFKAFIVRQKIAFPVLYLRVTGTSSQLKYECVEGAVKMCDRFAGYLFIADETFVNVKMFRKAPRDKVLVEGSFLETRKGVSAAEHNGQWSWWEKTGGKLPLLGVLNELAYRAHLDNDKSASEVLNNCFSFVNKSAVFHVMSAEFAYIPVRLASTLLYVTSLFKKYKANVELALPFFVCGLDPERDVHFVKVRRLPEQDLQKSERLFADGVMYIHPVKHRGNFKNLHEGAIICDP